MPLLYMRWITIKTLVIWMVDMNLQKKWMKSILRKWNPSQCRQGYAFEAVDAVVECLLEELHLDMIIAGAIEENVPSLNMLNILGFTYEGKKHKAFWYPPTGPVDMMMFYKERKNAE